jgi:hypothetical protein
MTRISNKTAKELGIDVPGSKNKYNNKKPTIDGHKFDSKKEARYYEKLKLLQKAGGIKKFELQPKFRLQDGFDDKEGNHHRPINYFADFKIWWSDGTVEVVDTKGFKTSVYKIKKKILLKKYPDINFREIYHIE